MTKCKWNSKTWVTSSNPRVTSSNPQVTNSNPQVTISNSRVRRLKARVRRLNARVARLKAQVRRLKARAGRLKARVKKENSEFKLLNFTSYKKFYFHGLANAELKPDTNVLKKLFHNVAFKKHIWPLYCHHTLGAGKLISTDSNKT